MERQEKAPWFGHQTGIGLRKAVVQSVLITLITWFGGPTPSAAQNTGNLRPVPPMIYVVNIAGGITEINGENNSVVATAADANAPSRIAIALNGKHAYVTHNFGNTPGVTLLDTATNVTLETIPTSGSGPFGIALTPDGAFAYVANLDSGNVSVIATATNTETKVITVGFLPSIVAISPDGSRAYVSNQGDNTVSVIATASNSVVASIPVGGDPFELRVTPDGRFLYVEEFFANEVAVVSTASNAVVNTIPVGFEPTGLEITPDGTRVYVGNFGSNNVSVIDTSRQSVIATIPAGSGASSVAITPDGAFAYVTNTNEGDVSVIATGTNSVVRTIPARVQPIAVTTTDKTRPRILKYSFVAFDPPGSVDTIPRAVNNHGQNVGSFVDGAGATHGYLRIANGSFVTIDPPGSTFTVAAGINDAGTIVGSWQDAGGAVHGFVRSPSGIYTTVDFPGAADTGIAGINDMGNISGSFDLGDMSTSIAFVRIGGTFTQFEDAAAVPMQTAAGGINSLNFVAGLYGDAAGNSHGLVRTPAGLIHNFDFPGADNTIPARLNDLGQAAGQYFTNFPAHGFIVDGVMGPSGPTSPSQYFSFDYPDSQASALRGINNSGQVAGFFRLRGDPARHGFLATPVTDQGQDINNQ